MNIARKMIKCCLFISMIGSILAKPVDSKKIDGSKISPIARAPGKQDLEFLQKLLKASPSQLRVMRKTIERVESMTSEQRAAMHKRLIQFRDASFEEKQKVFSHLKHRMRIFREYLNSLGEDEQAREIKYFQSLKEPER